MQNHLLGQTAALLCAVCWAVAIVCFKRCGNTIHPIALNLFKNVIGTGLFIITLLVLGFVPASFLSIPTQSVLILIVSGFIGIFIADTIFFHSLNLLGVTISSIVDCTYSPFVILFSFLLLSEKLLISDYIGIFLIISSVLILSNNYGAQEKSKKQITKGIIYGILSMALMAFSIVIVKPILNDFSIVMASTIRMIGATIGPLLMLIFLPKSRTYLAVFKPSKIWKLSIPASIMGAYIGTILWIASLKYTYVSVASILNQTSAIFAFIFATILLKEQFTKMKFISLLLAICGVVIIILY